MINEIVNEIIVSNSSELGNGIKCLLKDKIPKEILDNAINNYAYGLEADDVMAMLDISKKRNGKYGFVFAEEFVIFYEEGGDNSFVVYSDITDIEEIGNTGLLIKTKDEKKYRVYSELVNKRVLKSMLLDLRDICETEPKKEVEKRKIEQNLTYEEKLLLVKKSLCDIANGYKYYYGDSAPDKVVKSAIKKYDSRISERSILGIIDTSLFGNCKSGCMITEDSIYWTEMLGPVNRMKFDDLKTVCLMEKGANDSDNVIIMLTHYDLKSHNIEYNSLNKTPLSNLLEKLQTVRYEVIKDEE